MKRSASGLFRPVFFYPIPTMRLFMFEALLPDYIYCENVVDKVVSQPLNFLSSITFWLAAGWMWIKQRPDDEFPSFHQVTAILFFLLGFTGMFWHVGGHPIAMAADMLVLFMMMIVIVSVLCNDVLRLPVRRGVMAIVTIIILSALMRNESYTLLPQNGGLFLPTLFFLGLAALKVQTVSEKATVYLLTGSYLLLFALACRSLDLLICSSVSSGLHFMWHLLLIPVFFYIGKTLQVMSDISWEKYGYLAKDKNGKSH
jgi:hypothetical protein